MARVQPVLTETEAALVDQMAQLTRTKRTDVVKNAIAGSRVVARKPTGEEVTLETPELAALEGQGHRLSPEELGLLTRRLASVKDPAEAAVLRERLTRGVYGI